jgi:hypothetical protein
MKPKVYLETTIISYLTAWRSPQLIMAANQEATRIWWDEQRQKFDLYISAAVVQEASEGDKDAAQRRLALLPGIPRLSIDEEVNALAKQLIDESELPPKARLDAVHIATATVNGMDYLLTWNCRHIANATFRNAFVEICRSYGYELPVICTPLELNSEMSP